MYAVGSNLGTLDPTQEILESSIFRHNAETQTDQQRDRHRHTPEGDGVLILNLDPTDEAFLPSCFSTDEVRGLPTPPLLGPCLGCEEEEADIRE